jgi:Aminoglycoside-2''-adenylyltransferase
MLSSAHPTAAQLSLIQELTLVLRAARIPHWLFGGWAVDFLVGEITRPHSDVDLIIWRRDVPAFRQILVERGYAERPSPSGPELDAQFCKQDQPVEIMFLQEQEDGGACWGDWRLPPDALEARDGRLGEIICPVVSPRLLLGCKEECIRQASAPAEQKKHTGDVGRLRSLISAEASRCEGR